MHILTDIEEGLVVDLLKGHDKKIIKKWIEGRPDNKKIALVLMDMSTTESAAIETALPHCTIIVDRFHIIKKANELMDAVRLCLYPQRKKDREPGKKKRPRPEPFRMRRSELEGRTKYLEAWFKVHPELGIAYNLKEDFLEIWDDEFASVTSATGRSAAARKRYEQWEEKIPKEKTPQEKAYAVIRAECAKIQGTMKEWGTYIFKYFDCPFTNAFTESSNRKVKDDNRDLRSCSFKTARARLVFGTYLKREREKFVKQEEAQLRPNLHKPRRQNVDTAIMRARREALARLEKEGTDVNEPHVPTQISMEFLN